MSKRNPHRRRKPGVRKSTEYEPRRYTVEDESFAQRLAAGFRMMRSAR